MKVFKKTLAVLLVMVMLISTVPMALAASYTVTGKNTVTIPVVGYEPGVSHCNCWEFAQTIYQKIWGTSFSSYRGTNDDMLRSVGNSARSITADNTKQFISAAPLGSVIRISTVLDGNDAANTNYQHSQILIQKDENGFTVYEGNIEGKVRIKYFTWTNYASSWANWKYFKYIKYPNATAFQPGPHTCDKGTFIGAGGTHPHNSYWRCSICGESWREWWTNNYLESCEECVNHTCDKGTWLYFGFSHPHCDYYKCSLCGKEWMDSTSSNEYSSCPHCQIGTTVLTVEEGTSLQETKFTWTQAINADYYYLKIWAGKAWEGDAYKIVESFSTSASVLLPTGEYQAYVDACTGDGYRMSNMITFTVKEGSYTISYNANGGSGAPASQTKYQGKDISLSTAVPTKSGYTFVGWNTKADGTGTSYASGAKYSADGNVTLYAQWKSSTCTVMFNANGGVCSTSSKTVNVGSTYGIMPTPTRDGYTFDGWFTSASGGTLVTSASAVTSSGALTLYAHWTKSTVAEPTPDPEPIIKESSYSFNYKDTVTFNVPVTLESSNPNVASVSDNQIFMASTGNADVTVTFEDGNIEIYHINVSYSFLQWIIIIVLFGWIWY